MKRKFWILVVLAALLLPSATQAGGSGITPPLRVRKCAIVRQVRVCKWVPIAAGVRR